MSTVRKSVLLSFAEKHSVMVVQFASTLVLARLLTPAQIGVFSVAAVAISLAHTVRDFGIGQYIVQEKELTSDRIRAAFTLAIASAWLMAAALVVLSGPFASFYNEPGIAEVMRLLAVNFLLLPFSTVALALWRRDMNFTQPYIIKTSGAIVHATTAVVMAYLGFGYMSMAWAAVASIGTMALISNIHRPPHMPWLPGIKEWRRVLSFGGLVSGAVVVKELGQGAPDLILGRVLSMGSVGMFGRAMGMVLLFEKYVGSAIRTIILPHFSSQHREGKPVKLAYLQALSMVSGLAWPFFGFLALMAFPITRIMYGDQWDAAVPLVKILAMYGALNILFYFGSDTLLSVGAAKKNMQFELLRQPVIILLILAGVFFGLEYVASALVLGALLSFLISYRLLHATIGLTFADIVQATRKSAGLCAISLLLPGLVAYFMNMTGGNLWLPLLMASLGFGLSWLFGVTILEHPLHNEVKIGLKKAASILK